MSSYLYYRRFSPVIADMYYDRIALEVVKEWNNLDSLRKWQLGSIEELKATGHHFKITASTENAAIAWHLKCKGTEPQGHRVRDEEWKERVISTGATLRYVSAESVGFIAKKPKPTPKPSGSKTQQLSLF